MPTRARRSRVASPRPVSGLVGGDPTVGKQFAANNSEERMMQGGDLESAVRSAVIGMMAESRDEETADTLLRDGDKMSSYSRLVFRLLAGGLSREALLRLG